MSAHPAPVPPGLRASAPASLADLARLSLDRFATAGMVLAVRSSLLDEVVLFASDNATLAKDERRRVYRAADLDRLLRREPVRLPKTRVA